MMEKIQAWIEKYLVPAINKITSNFWFGGYFPNFV